MRGEIKVPKGRGPGVENSKGDQTEKTLNVATLFATMVQQNHDHRSQVREPDDSEYGGGENF
jgi:hypothetical protein